AKNKNTERFTKNWMMKFEEFRTSSGYLTPLTNLDDVRQIEKKIVEYISGMKKKDDNDYRANSIKQAVDAISRFLLYNSPIQVNLHDQYLFLDLYTVLHKKMRDLQEHGFGEIKRSIALNSQQIQEILQHSRIDRSNPVNLLYHIFIYLSILLAMHGGEHYQLKVDQFKIDKHDTVGLCNDIKFYLSKRPSVADPEFYLQPSSDWIESGNWYKKNHVGKNKLMNFMCEIGRITQIDIPMELLTNHSGQKTAAQCLQDNNIPEQAIMQLTGHRSVQGSHAYKQVNKDQQLNTLNTLINITDSFANDNNTNNNNSSSRNPLQEITHNMNFSENNFNSSNKKFFKMPIFNNCYFMNITFNIQK
ncbi:8542_t:CDS:2, partial [Racocetra persica]